jgi:hypothetical protein
MAHNLATRVLLVVALIMVGLTPGIASARGAARDVAAAPLPGTTLVAVSCPRATWCMTVGGGREGYGLAQLWNGRSWRTLATPPVRPYSMLTGVSCPSPASCVAVGRPFGRGGSPFADAWNGRRWRALTAPIRPSQAELDAVSCWHADRCVAVGSGPAGSALAGLWNGRSWRWLTAVSPPGASSSAFSSVSCPDATHCVAVGQYTASGGQSGLAEAWNGSAWTLINGPALADPLTDVSCPAPGACVAVGGLLLAARWDGSTWTQLTMPAPGAINVGLFGVSCATRTSCIAIGEKLWPQTTGIFADEWSGGPGFSSLTVPDPARAGREPAAISCPAPTACMAVGDTASDAGTPDVIPLAEYWNGSTWRSMRTQKADWLGAVSCLSPSACLAVGAYANRADNPQVLTQQWRGAGLRLAGPASTTGDFTDISCARQKFCMAIGQNFGRGADLAYHWNGRRWTPGHSLAPLRQVACTRPGFCLALASGLGTELWNGTSWTTGPSLPRGPVYAVSCASPDYCMAVGAYITDPHSGTESTLAETWNGSAWKILRTPSPGQSALLTAVACARPAGCMAIGDYTGSGNHSHNLALLRSHGTWRVFSLPGGTGFGLGQASISCPRLDSCMAVGTDDDQVTGSHNLALAWNGARWRLTKLHANGLADVFCPLPDRCIAVGQSGARTLADAWNGSAWRRLRSANP